MVTLNQLSINLKRLLKQNNIEDYIFESRCILEHILHIDHNKLILNHNILIDEKQAELIMKAADKRISGYPLQYILGEWEFFGLPFYVGEGVLIPRADTELLVECVLETAANSIKPKIIDLCSGSGCVAIAVDKNLATSDISAVEYSPDAFQYFLKNIALNNSSVIPFNENVLNKDFIKNFNNIDIIAANPPYLTANDMLVLQKEVQFEPETALIGGDDGLFFYRNITALWKNCLAENGTLIYEIGKGQENDVSAIMQKHGFIDIKTFYDLNGIIRVVSGVYTKSCLK